MKEPINPVFPVAELATLAQLMDIAVAVEREAAERFDTLAEAMQRQGNPDTAALFRELAQEERAHEAEITGWAVRADRRQPAPARYPWRMPETLDPAETGAGGTLLDPERALTIATRNEERTFAFYTYLAAIAEDDRVRQRAEALAKGELDHVARLRAKRRRLIRDQPGKRGRRWPRAGSLEQFRRLALGLERGSAHLNAALAARLERSGNTAAASALSRLGERSRHTAEGLAAAEAPGAPPVHPIMAAAHGANAVVRDAPTPAEALRLAAENAEAVLETYLTVAECSRDEAVVREAQRLGETAVANLALVGAQSAHAGR